MYPWGASWNSAHDSCVFKAHVGWRGDGGSLCSIAQVSCGKIVEWVTNEYGYSTKEDLCAVLANVEGFGDLLTRRF